MISSCTEPYERGVLGQSRLGDCDAKAEPASPVRPTFVATTPCLSWKLISPPDEALINLIPMEYPKPWSASRRALTTRSTQNSFVKIALPIPAKKPLTARQLRTTKFDFGLLVMGRLPAQGSAVFPYDLAPRNGSADCVEQFSFGNSTSVSAFVDKAYLPGIKPTIKVTIEGKEKVISRRNYFSLSIDTPFKVRKLNPPSRGLYQ